MKRSPYAGFYIALIAIALLLCYGCLTSGDLKVPNSIPAAGNDISQAKAHVESAEAGVQALKPFVRREGVAVVGLVSKEHKAAVGKMDDASAALVAVQSERDELAATIKRQAGTIGTLRDTVNKVTHSWGYRLELFCIWAFWILATLLGIHIVAGALAIFLPVPYNSIAAIVANIVNPLGWINWLVTHSVKNAQANTAASKMEMLPPAPPPPPNH